MELREMAMNDWRTRMGGLFGRARKRQLARAIGPGAVWQNAQQFCIEWNGQQLTLDQGEYWQVIEMLARASRVLEADLNAGGRSRT